MTATVAGLIDGGARGWTARSTLALAAAAAVLVVGFVRVERRSAAPMLPLAMLRRQPFAASVGNGFAFQFGGYGVQFMLALHIQRDWHDSAATTGRLLVPFAAMWMLGTGVVNRRMVPRGPRATLWPGAVVALAGALVLLPVAARPAVGWLLGGTWLIGLGCGVFSPSLNQAAMLAIAHAGLGSGVLNTFGQLGMAVGVAVLGALATSSAFALRVGIDLVAGSFAVIVALTLRSSRRSRRRPGRGGCAAGFSTAATRSTAGHDVDVEPCPPPRR